MGMNCSGAVAPEGQMRVGTGLRWFGTRDPAAVGPNRPMNAAKKRSEAVVRDIHQPVGNSRVHVLKR
jgi:hypothetical protein